MQAEVPEVATEPAIAPHHAVSVAKHFKDIGWAVYIKDEGWVALASILKDADGFEKGVWRNQDGVDADISGRFGLNVSMQIAHLRPKHLRANCSWPATGPVFWTLLRDVRAPRPRARAHHRSSTHPLGQPARPSPGRASLDRVPFACAQVNTRESSSTDVGSIPPVPTQITPRPNTPRPTATRPTARRSFARR